MFTKLNKITKIGIDISKVWYGVVSFILYALT